MDQISAPPQKSNIATRLSFYIPLGLIAMALVLCLIGVLITLATGGLAMAVIIPLYHAATELGQIAAAALIGASAILSIIAFVRTEAARFYSLIVPVALFLVLYFGSVSLNYRSGHTPTDSVPSALPPFSPFISGETPTFPIDDRHVESKTGGKTYLVEFTQSENEEVAILPQKWKLGGRHDQPIRKLDISSDDNGETLRGDIYYVREGNIAFYGQMRDSRPNFYQVEVRWGSTTAPWHAETDWLIGSDSNNPVVMVSGEATDGGKNLYGDVEFSDGNTYKFHAAIVP